jgi:hypothetical protein
MTHESSSGTGEREIREQDDEQAALEKRARQITIEVWQKAEREYLARIPRCLARGHPERAEAWARAAKRARQRWQAAKRGDPAWVREYYQN